MVYAQNVELAVANFVPHVRVEIDTTSLNEKTIAKKIHFFNTAGARRELANPYNFASFYLAEYFRCAFVSAKWSCGRGSCAILY